jgi:beta-lactamase regulating signal transducer with metallopeptidase domain
MASSAPRCSIRICRCLGAIRSHSRVCRAPRLARRLALAPPRTGRHGRRYARLVRSARRPPTLRRAASLSLSILLTLALCAFVSPAALAATSTGGNAFNELTEGRSEATTTTTASRASHGSTSETATNSQTVIILALVAAVLLLVGIAFVIARDARKVAPAGDPELTAGVGSRDWAARQRKRRAKAKAARQQRKRNR